MVCLELASFGKTEVLDLDRVFTKKGYVLVTSTGTTVCVVAILRDVLE